MKGSGAAGETGPGGLASVSVFGIVVALVLATVAAPAALVGSAGAQETVDCSFPVTATDATGTEVTVETEPDRVVALAPSAAQQLWHIGVRDRVVGMPVNEHTAYLDDRGDVTNVVGEDGQPIQEEVVGLEPDLVLAPNVIDNDTVRSLREAELTVYRYHEAPSLEDVSDEIETTGLLVGHFEAAAERSAGMQAAVESVRSNVAGEQRPRVYYDLGGGWTAGANTFINDMIETAGGENIAATAGIEGYAEISEEVIADADPEVIVLHENASVPDTPAIQNSTAVREDELVRVDPNFINQPGSNTLVPFQRMADAFHAGAVTGFDPSEVGSEPARCAAAVTDGGDTASRDSGGGNASDGVTADRSASGDGTEDGGTPDDDTDDGDAAETAGGDGSGFGVVGALVAVLAVVTAATRR